MSAESDKDLVNYYLASMPEGARNPLKDAIDAIYKAAPDADVLINYGTLAFALVPGGKRDAQVMVAGYKKHIGFYPHPTTIAHFESELKGRYKYAKGSVQFPLSEPVPADLIFRMVQYRKGLMGG